MHDLLGKRKHFLTAKRLLTNPTFRDISRTDTLDVDQRLKITSLTFLFTDLKGSTELYERVGDLVAYDMVREHFRVLHEVVASHAGAVVKTIGDAVMATFATPDQAVAAALEMRDAMGNLHARAEHDLVLKIGVHEGPCLAVMVNDRLDYFGQTVNIAARVQGLAVSRSIFATKTVVNDKQAADLLGAGFDESAVEVVAGHAGPAYGVPHEATIEAIRLAGRTEALVLDPVYSGKGLAGLIAMIRQGRWRNDEDVIFLHTGGAPALFAYQSALGI